MTDNEMISRVAEIDRLLDNRQGSFYEWLSQN